MHINKIIIMIITCFITLSNVSASSCPNGLIRDLSKKANYVKAGYEIIDNSKTKEIVIGKDKGSYYVPNFTYEFSIYNITKDLKLLITEYQTKENKTITYDMTNKGNYTFNNYDYGSISNYKIEVYSNNENCDNKKLRTIKLTKPKYNPYSEYTFCKDSTVLYCRKFIDKDLGIKDSNDFLKKIKVNNEENNPNNYKDKSKDELITMFKKNWKLYLSIFISVVIVMTVFLVIKAKKNKTSGWKL